MKKEARRSFLVRLNLGILDITEFVCGELKRRKMSRKKLAQKMKISASRLAILLNDLPEDFRLSDLLRLADALNMGIDLSKVFVPKNKKDGEYIAMKSFSDKTIVAHGKDVGKIIDEAKKLGVPDPVIMFVPPKDTVCIY